MELTTIIFWLFACVIFMGGVAIVFVRNLVHALVLLFVCLFGVAAFFVFGGAEFLAATQVVIYVGGILILMLIGVMLTQKLKEADPETGLVNLVPGFVIGLILFGFLTSVVFENTDLLSVSADVKVDDVEMIGVETLTGFLLPFELVSVLLLATLVGATYLARKSRKETEI